VDDASLLSPVAEETLSTEAPSEAATEAPAHDSAAHLGSHTEDHHADPAAHSSDSEHLHNHHEASTQDEVAQHGEQEAPGIESKLSSVADGRELRTTTSGHLRAATEHSIMSIASGELHKLLPMQSA
jgi:septal ring-binding cell division protein DamX